MNRVAHLLLGESIPIEPPGEQLRSISSMRYHRRAPSQFGPQRIDIQVGFQVDQTASCRFYVRSGGADYEDAIACS